MPFLAFAACRRAAFGKARAQIRTRHLATPLRLIRRTDDQNHFGYIHYNPVKHGYAGSALDWPHSSFRRWLHKGHYAADWAMPMDDDVMHDVGDAG
jgi:hypothetical protein